MALRRCGARGTCDRIPSKPAGRAVGPPSAHRHRPERRAVAASPPRTCARELDALLAAGAKLEAGGPREAGSVAACCTAATRRRR